MNSKKPRKVKIVYFGTGPISVATAEELNKYFDIEAIITKTDRAKPNGMLQPTLLADWARSHDLKIFKVENKASLDEVFKNNRFESKVGVVVDFGIIISEKVIDSFPKGILNSHFSLLPKYRGADPITAALLHGDKQTGVSIMLIEPTLDTGQLLVQETFTIPADMDIVGLEDSLTQLGAKLLVDIIPPYLEGVIEPTVQAKAGISYTKMLKKEDGRLDPTKTATQLANQVRAFMAWPKSYFEQNTQRYIITQVKPTNVKTESGKLTVKDNILYYGCKDGSLEILEIQPAGKPKMNAAAFVNGYSNSIV